MKPETTVPDWITPIEQLPFLPTWRRDDENSEAIIHLRGIGIYLAGDFLNFTLEEIAATPSFGHRRIGELIVWLAERGETLADFGDPVFDLKRARIMARTAVQRMDKSNARRGVYSGLVVRSKTTKPFCYSVENYPS
jgi:hypothetical protein